MNHYEEHEHNFIHKPFLWLSRERDREVYMALSRREEPDWEAINERVWRKFRLKEDPSAFDPQMRDVA